MEERLLSGVRSDDAAGDIRKTLPPHIRRVRSEKCIHGGTLYLSYGADSPRPPRRASSLGSIVNAMASLFQRPSDKQPQFFCFSNNQTLPFPRNAAVEQEAVAPEVRTPQKHEEKVLPRL